MKNYFRKSLSLFLALLLIFSNFSQIPLSGIGFSKPEILTPDPNDVLVTQGKWIKNSDNEDIWIFEYNGVPIAFTKSQYRQLVVNPQLSGKDRFFAIETVNFSDLKEGNVGVKEATNLNFLRNQALLKLENVLDPKNVNSRAKVKTHIPRKEMELILKQPTPNTTRNLPILEKIESGISNGSKGRQSWRWGSSPDGFQNNSGHYLKAGASHAKESLKISLSPKGIIATAGVASALELGRQVLAGEKPSVKKVASLLTSAEFVGGFAGSITGSAAGSLIAPVLTAVPFVGGFLSAMAPAFGAVAGSMFGGEFGRTGSWKKALKAIDPYDVVGRGVGSVLGAAIGLPLGPFGGFIGSMIGGAVGGWVAGGIKSLVSLFSKGKEKRDLEKLKTDLNQWESLNRQNPEQSNIEKINHLKTKIIEIERIGTSMNRANQKNVILLIDLQKKYSELVKQGNKPEAEKVLQQIWELKEAIK